MPVTPGLSQRSTELIQEIAASTCADDLVAIVTENRVCGEDLAAFKAKAGNLGLTPEEWNEIYVWSELNSEIEAYAYSLAFIN